MYYKLTDFEQALKRKYTCDIELVHFKEAQDIIDYYRFTHQDLTKFLIGPYMVSTLDSLNPDHFAFAHSADAMSNIIDLASNKWCFFVMDDEREPAPNTGILVIKYALITAQHNKEKYLKLLHQLERLRAFL